MATQSRWRSRLSTLLVTLGATVFAVLVGSFAFTDLPQRLGFPGASSVAPEDVAQASGDVHDKHPADDHEGHDHEGHDHEGGAAENVIDLSPQARANLGLRVEPVSVGRFTEYIEVPATITEWPGRTHVAITSPLTGVINAIYVSRGEMIDSGTPLFTLRLTHQDLVETQEQFLASLGQLDIEQREIARLTPLASSGAAPGKTLITRQYERDKLLARLRAARQSMLLHGLAEDQINRIEETRELIREVTIYAPTLHADRSLHHDSLHHDPLHESEANADGVGDARFASLAQPPPVDPEHVETEFLVTQLDANRGDSVEAGDRLGQLSDYSQLLIEGYAYQRDGEALRRAAEAELPLQAVLETASGKPAVIDDLKIVYIGNEINRQSRALPFFVALPNEIERSERMGKNSYVSWRYKPGQRLQLRVPMAGFDNAIVVPKNAVAEEGAERYVFVENDDHFERVPVHVLASDSMSVAIANDGQLWPGQSIAVNAAHQLQMAMNNLAGGGVDPHAGHNH